MLESVRDFKNLKVLEGTFLGNTGLDYVLFFATFVALFIFIKAVERVLLDKLRKTDKRKKSLKTVLIEFVLSIKTSLYLFTAFVLSLLVLPTVNDQLFRILQIVLSIWITIRLVIGIQLFIDYILRRKLLDDSDPGTEVAAKNMGTIFKVLLWIVVILFFLSNFGVEVTSLIAGLGVGGVAIAFALQNVLEDLFSSFAIYFDKPFTIGDFIEVDGQWGSVEKIGLKTTRIRALQGEEIVMANRELTDKRIHNFKRLDQRRGVFEFGVTYDTSHEKMKRIPEIVRNIISSEELTEFDRAHFNGFGDSALEYEVAYFVKSDDFKKFRDIHESILLNIKKEFEKEGIDMAFPTRTVHLFNK